MKIKIEDSWLNQKCNECSELIYPNKVCKVRPENGKVSVLSEWRFCKPCYERLFSEEVKKNAENKK